jgi:hypothetical protein
MDDRRKPRSKDDQIVMRVATHTKEAFQAAAARIAEAVAAADGGALSQANCLEYFMAWISELPFPEQTQFIRGARRVFQAVQDRREEEAARAASPAESAARTVGGHTRGERVPMSEAVKPRRPRRRGRSDRKEMRPKVEG